MFGFAAPAQAQIP
jgi:hypothetical protein